MRLYIGREWNLAIDREGEGEIGEVGRRDV